MAISGSLAFVSFLLGMISVYAPVARARFLAACFFLVSTTVAAFLVCVEPNETLQLREASLGLCALLPVLCMWIMLLCRRQRLLR
jgi:Mn2+/Fe2+ NRAMP family transporter